MNTVGTVSELWRFPVKSMQGHRLKSCEISGAGVLGDRAYALIDDDTGKVVSAKNVQQFPQMMACLAEFTMEPVAGHPAPPVRIHLPAGASITSNARDANDVLSAFFGRSVRLVRSAPADFTIDQYHPDLENLDPQGHRDTVVAQKLGAALFAEMGMASPLAPGSFLDLFPISIMTSSTLGHLRELAPKTRFEIRRFRMNVLVRSEEEGFVENGWLGRAVEMGGQVQVQATMPDPRCVMTTLEQEGLPQDTGVLQTLARHNRLDIGGGALFPCAGIYAVVSRPGRVQVGDLVRLPASLGPA